MAKLKIGDRIECKLKKHIIVNAYDNDYDEILSFEIILIDSGGYSLYIPHYINVKGSISLDEERINDWGVNPKFLDEKTFYIRHNCVYKVINIVDGCTCAHCKEFYHFAQPNQENGTLICWLCRAYPYR